MDLLLIVDGATDSAADPLASLRAANTPVLDRLARTGTVDWLDLLDDGVPVGSETAIAALLGWQVPGAVDRGLVEAAARDLTPAPGEQVWRVDFDGERGRDRVLFFGERLPSIESTGDMRVWPAGLRPPRILDAGTLVIGAPGAATGLGRLMGASAVTPAGANGLPDSDLGGKLEAVRAASSDTGTRLVVVHVGGADMAAHARDRALKIAFLERVDRELIGPLSEIAGQCRGSLRVCTDHGCDPETGHHVGGPVPCVTWAGRSER